jgi:hypothetical protein
MKESELGKELVRKLGPRRTLRILRSAFDPRNENYVGHNLARTLKLAKCICPPVRYEKIDGHRMPVQDRDVNCPFHGR